jgi:rhodanese-related sulfurtransferase
MNSHDDAVAEAVKQVLGGHGVLVDVRRDDEWNYARAKRAVHVPITQLEHGEVPDIPKEKNIYTYCQAGGRAGRAVSMLKDMGYDHVTNIGGLNDWTNAGGELEE